MKRLARLVLLAALSPAAFSQSVLYTFDGDSRSVRQLGDLKTLAIQYTTVMVGHVAPESSRRSRIVLSRFESKGSVPS